MPTLLLLRKYNLSDEEVQKLPEGCRGVLMKEGQSAVVARADVPFYTSFSDIISLSVAMGRAIPNAQIGYCERTISHSHMITLPCASWNVELSHKIYQKNIKLLLS